VRHFQGESCVAFKLKLVELLTWDDPQELCRDEQCPFEGVHKAGSCRTSRQEACLADRAGKVRSALDECVYDWVTTRFVRTFRDVYSDVIQDYGSITERGVYRALERLIDAHRVIRVVPWPNGRLLRLGAYLRYDSPLIWDLSGHANIQEQLRDCGVVADAIPLKPARAALKRARKMTLTNDAFYG